MCRGNENWEDLFAGDLRITKMALESRNTEKILCTLFDRLYVLRNQLLHGGATWNSSVNRAQVSDGASIMYFLTPIFINLMMDHPNIPWGDNYYPVSDSILEPWLKK